MPQVAAGFLYLTDSSLGFLDCFVSNPRAGGRDVHRAIEEILLALAEDAKRGGMTIVIGNTKHASIAKIAKRLGGSADQGYVVLGKAL